MGKKIETTDSNFHEVRLQFVEAILAQKQLAKANDPKVLKAYKVCEKHLDTMQGMAKDTGKYGTWVGKAQRMMKNFEHNAEYARNAKKAEKVAKAAEKAKSKKVEEKKAS